MINTSGRLNVGRLIAIIAVLAVLYTPASGQAQNVAAAKNLAKEGVAMAKAGKYKEALKLLLQSKHLGKVMGVNWNIGRCYEHLGDLEHALPYFRTFLKKVKGSHYEAKAKKKVEAIEYEIDKKRQVHLVARPGPGPLVHAIPKPSPIVRIQPPKPAYSKIKAGLFWGGIASVGVAAIFNIWGYVGWKHTISSNPRADEVASARSSAKWKFYTAYSLYGVGAACVITSFFVGHGKHPLGFAAMPTANGGGALVITGTW